MNGIDAIPGLARGIDTDPPTVRRFGTDVNVSSRM
jgi:hypothetical protein